MVVEQDELQNECRSRETCSFGTPDAVVCKAARSASAVLAAVGRSVGIGAWAGGWIWWRTGVFVTHQAPSTWCLAPPRLPFAAMAWLAGSPSTQAEGMATLFSRVEDKAIAAPCPTVLPREPQIDPEVLEERRVQIMAQRQLKREQRSLEAKTVSYTHLTLPTTPYV